MKHLKRCLLTNSLCFVLFTSEQPWKNCQVTKFFKSQSESFGWKKCCFWFSDANFFVNKSFSLNYLSDWERVKCQLLPGGHIYLPKGSFAAVKSRQLFLKLKKNLNNTGLFAEYLNLWWLFSRTMINWRLEKNYSSKNISVLAYFCQGLITANLLREVDFHEKLPRKHR